MQKPRHLFPAVCVLATLVGCGSSLSPLDSAQKDRFRTTLGHLASVSNALQSQTGSLRNDARLSTLLGAFGTVDAGTRTSTDDETQALKQAIGDALASGACQAKNNMSTAVGSSSLNGPIQVAITGDRCPIAFSLVVSGTMSKTDMDLEYNLFYTVKSDDVRKLADVDGLSLKGTLKGTTASANTNMQLALEGSLHSRTENDAGFYANLDVAEDTSSKKFSGEIAFGVKLSDFTGELKMKGSNLGASSSGDDVHYYLNDQEITAAEFGGYLRDFKGLTT